jgi:hypothetical protein
MKCLRCGTEYTGIECPTCTQKSLSEERNRLLKKQNQEIEKQRFNIGPQNEVNDDKLDKTHFLKKARKHQSEYRAKILRLGYDTYGNYLTQNDAKNGNNFYKCFEILDSVNKYRKFKRIKNPTYRSNKLYNNMLRSEHIPFNFFVPLNYNVEYLKKILNEITGNTINFQGIYRLEIEYPRQNNYLNDKTAFDVCIAYLNKCNEKGIIGIEIKYTERGYHPGKKEKREIDNQNSIYYDITRKCGVYKEDAIRNLKKDDYRQIWRNHLLGESILINDVSFKEFTLITLFPEGNIHFQRISMEYKKFIKEEYENRIKFFTYEKYFEILDKYCLDIEFKKWIEYLKERYIVVE